MSATCHTASVSDVLASGLASRVLDILCARESHHDLEWDSLLEETCLDCPTLDDFLTDTAISEGYDLTEDGYDAFMSDADCQGHTREYSADGGITVTYDSNAGFCWISIPVDASLQQSLEIFSDIALGEALEDAMNEGA